ncbi:MAG: hypothetical protein ACM3WQ_06795 [Chloroflexota bacterium]|nr:hypothetical protein [Candidatus Sulfotelmatobacter sp.]
MSERRKKIYVKPKPEDFDEAERAEHEGETEDIYNTEERERMLENDEITDAEEGFMIGHEQEPPNKRETRRKSHDDSVSGRLAEEDAQED